MRTWKFSALLAAAAAFCVPATASAAFVHVVAPGESLASVAATDGLSVDQLAAANGISPDSPLIAGSSLVIPPQTPAEIASGAAVPAGSSAMTGGGSPAPVTAPASAGGYVVQPGDTLWSIAARYGVTVNQLAAANGLSPTGVLVSGTTLSVAGAPSSGASSSGASSSGGAVSEEAVETSPGTAEEVSTSTPTATPGAPPGATMASVSPGPAGAQPTPEFASPATVGSIAAANGVPPSLAQAIAYQESGFNNNEVSTTGAVGVMQIEPGTWNYIGQNLAGPPPLSPASATDNVRAGTLLLHSLLNATGGDQAMAAAAYYQGLPSIRAHGILPATQQYVNDVMALQQRFGGGG